MSNYSKITNKPLENIEINDEQQLNNNSLIQQEAIELFEKNKENPCFLCKNYINSIFSNRKGRRIFQVKYCKRCEHSKNGKPYFFE